MYGSHIFFFLLTCIVKFTVRVNLPILLEMPHWKKRVLYLSALSTRWVSTTAKLQKKLKNQRNITSSLEVFWKSFPEKICRIHKKTDGVSVFFGAALLQSTPQHFFFVNEDDTLGIHHFEVAISFKCPQINFFLLNFCRVNQRTELAYKGYYLSSIEKRERWAKNRYKINSFMTEVPII